MSRCLYEDADNFTVFCAPKEKERFEKLSSVVFLKLRSSD